MISLIAMLVAVPIGLASAIYLSEYASSRVRGFFKPVLEVLVGIPTVVYGFFALTFMTPLLRGVFGSNVVDFFNILRRDRGGILIVPDQLLAEDSQRRARIFASGGSRPGGLQIRGLDEWWSLQLSPASPQG
jgi:ABC-type phosphate transport system permease subunit